MPRQLVIRTIEEKLGGQNIILYGNNIVDVKCKPLIKKLADSMVVSYQACYIRLKGLNLFDRWDMSEYLEKI